MYEEALGVHVCIATEAESQARSSFSHCGSGLCQESRSPQRADEFALDRDAGAY